MSFFAENNRIRITNQAGETIFDTDTPMPHIVQQLSGTVTHTFPDVPHRTDGSQSSSTTNLCTTTETRYECEYVTECDYVEVCEPDFFGEIRCRDEFRCEQVRECTFNTYIVPIPFGTYTWNISSVVDASEREWTYKIGDISDSVNADFIVVTMNGNRTGAGSHFEYGTFVSALPASKDVAGNGSAILESSFLSGGQSWLRRIVSVYVSGSAVYAQFKHSSRARNDLYSREVFGSCFPGAQYPPGYNTSSSFSISFTVQVGKFTQ